MSADSHGGAAPDGGAHSDENAVDPISREDIESSVLDALRPLLGPKRKKSSSTEQTAPDAGTRDLASTSKASPEPSTPAANHAEAIDDEPSLPAAARDVAEPDAPRPRAASASPTDDIETATDQDRTPDMTYHVKAADAEDKALDSFVSGRESEDFETFLEIGGDLERRSRRSATMARLLDQHHAQLQTAEKERDEAFEKLARVYPVVQETARALKEAMDSRKVDPDPSRMARLFQLNGRALDELEKVAVTIFADFLWCKSAWELYAKTVGDARELRANADS